MTALSTLTATDLDEDAADASAMHRAGLGVQHDVHSPQEFCANALTPPLWMDEEIADVPGVDAGEVGEDRATHARAG